MFQDKVVINKNSRLNDNFYHLSFSSEKIADALNIGQFIYMRLTDGVEPLLRRPFSVAFKEGFEINIIYKILGKGTLLLSKKRVGEIVDVMGPLGNGFSLQKNKSILLVAGGVGIASLVSLARHYKADNVSLIYGAKTKDEFISNELLGLQNNVIDYVTDDGSFGKKGFVSVPLENKLGALDSLDNTYVYTCGPMGMLEVVVKLLNKYKVKGQANLEERMGCGVGACLGCATETRDGIKMVCTDGPVFSAEELGW